MFTHHHFTKPVSVLLALCLICTPLQFACGTQRVQLQTSDTQGGMPTLTGTMTVCIDELVQEVIPAATFFAKSNPELEVIIETIPAGIDSLIEREAAITSLQARILSGKGPDVMYLFSSSVSLGSLFPDEVKTMAAGMLEDLNDWLPKETLQALHPVVLTAGQYKGSQFLMPTDYQVEGMIFSSKSYPAAAAMLEEMQTSYHLAAILPQIYSLYEDPVRIVFDIPAAIHTSMIDYETGAVILDYEGLTLLLECNKRSIEATSDSYWMGDFLLYVDKYFGNIPLYVYSDIVDAYKKVDEHPIPVIQPNGQGGVSASVYSYAAIPANSKNKSAAAAFIDFLLSEEYQSTYIGESEKKPWAHALPVRRDSLPLYVSGIGFKGEAAIRILDAEKRLDAAVIVPYNFRKLVDAELDSYYNGVISAQQALENIESRLIIYF